MTRAAAWTATKAHTRLEWGRFLLDQGETERARQLLAQAHDVAVARGMAGVAAAAESLLAT